MDEAFEVLASATEYRRVLACGASERLDDALRESASVLGLAGEPRRLVLSRAWDLRKRHRMDHASIQAMLFGRRGSTLGLRGSNMVPELRAGNSLADWVSLVPGAETAIEIKSPFDNVKRLPTQLRDYRSTFPSVTVVAHEKNLRAVSALIDSDRTGVVVVSGFGSRARVHMERSPRVGFHEVQLRHLLATLRMRELSAAVERLTAQRIDTSQVSAFLEAERLLEPFDIELVGAEVFRSIRQRRQLTYAAVKSRTPAAILPILVGIDPSSEMLDYLVGWLDEGV